MKTSTKIIVGIIAVVILAGAWIVSSQNQEVSAPVGGSPVGTQFGTQKIASKTWSLSSGSATTTSLYNSDTQDRIIDSSFVACSGVGSSKTAYTGAGLANLIVRAATTTSDAPAIVSNTNYSMNILSFATSTPWSYVATSTEGILNQYSRVWPAETYLTFSSNATNTAQCTAGVRYFNL